MGTGDELGPDQGVFSQENLGIDGFQLLSADVIVPVAAVGPLEVSFRHLVVDKGLEDLSLVIDHLVVNFPQTGGNFLVNFSQDCL